MSEKILYRLDDNILFRKCNLFSGCKLEHGDCTNFHNEEIQNQNNYFCNQEGIHFHCAKDPEIELEFDREKDDPTLFCPKCKNEISILSLKYLQSQCFKALNREVFKDAKLVRLDDWYVPELKEKIKDIPNYQLITNVKTDKDGDTIVVLYVCYTGSKEKVQFFIKPEKCQLTSDHKDMDPSKIISKIEVTLKDRKLTQEYNND